MPGLYIHIPFCRQACHYCDFHFSTSLKYKDDMLKALLHELSLRHRYLADKSLETIYFGGGTPSLLSSGEINRLTDEIAKYFDIKKDAEITLEANPDDLDRATTDALADTAVNRLSVGVQSFYDEDLKWMNRSHSAEQALSAIKRVQDKGFENLTLDLIYGFPELSNEKWKKNIRTAVQLGVVHISSYALTVEPRTALAHLISRGKQEMISEDQSAEQFIILMDELEQEGFIHYEISNFCREGYHSIHNTNYWLNKHYLGIGPSAHSYNGVSRQWNISNNAQYMDGIGKGIVPFEREELNTEQLVNEYLMTALRTIRGIDLGHMHTVFGSEIAEGTRSNAEIFIEKGWLISNDRQLTLSREGKLFADRIASELFIIH